MITAGKPSGDRKRGYKPGEAGRRHQHSGDRERGYKPGEAGRRHQHSGDRERGYKPGEAGRRGIATVASVSRAEGLSEIPGVERVFDFLRVRDLLRGVTDEQRHPAG